MTTISRSVDAIADNFIRHRPEVISEAHPGEEIDDHSGEIGRIRAELSRPVVPGKDVVVVVPTFTKSHNCNNLVLGWIYLSFIITITHDKIHY